MGIGSIEKAFFLVASVELGARLFGFDEVSFFTKPLLLLILSVFFYLSVRDHYTLFHKLIQAGLFFSWLGDVFLMWDDKGELYFMLGLGAFLLAHIAYILGFRSSIARTNTPSIIWKRPMIIIPYILLAGFVYYQLYPSLSSLAGPVFIYSFALLLMVLFALNRRERVPDASFKWVFYGALLFMLSDMLLAYNKFSTPFQYANLAIMATYISGQYMIVKGCISNS